MLFVNYSILLVKPVFGIRMTCRFFSVIFKKKTSATHKQLNTHSSKIKRPNDLLLMFFWEEFSNEIKTIGWPMINKLLKQFVVVMINLVFSAIIIYSTDSLFSLGNKLFF